MKNLLFGTVFTIITVSIALSSATFVLAAESYNSSRSNLSSITQINKDIEDILLQYNLGDAEINKVKDSLAAGIDEDNLKSMLVGFGISEKNVADIIVKVNDFGINVTHTHDANKEEIKLPDVGLTPDSPFYFFKRATEAVGEFFTFNIEAKARLQAKRALERIAEVKVMLAKKEVNQKGVDIALSRLQSNITKAAEIVQKEQQKGKDVSALAKELDTNFEIRKRLLKRTLNDKGDRIEFNFKQKKAELKDQLLKAKLSGDDKKVIEIKSILNNIEQRKEDQESLLDQREKDIESTLDAEEKRFENALEEKAKKLELKEKETERVIEQRKKEFEKQFKEAGNALDLEEKLLEDQFDLAISSGDTQSIEIIKEKLIAIGKDSASLDSKFELSKSKFNEIDKNFGLLILKKVRNLEDFAKQDEVTLKESEIEMKKAFKEREIMSKRQFKTQESGLELQERRLESQIFKAKQSCELAQDSAVCFTEKVSPLKERLIQIYTKKQQLELKAEQADRSLEFEGRQMERNLELEKRKSEFKREEQERVIEARKEGYKRLKEEENRKTERQKEYRQRLKEQEKKREEYKREKNKNSEEKTVNDTESYNKDQEGTDQEKGSEGGTSNTQPKAGNPI